MEENTNQVNNTEAAAPVEKKGLFRRAAGIFKKDKTPAEPSGDAVVEPKKTLGQKIKDNKGKIIGGAVTAAAVGFAALKILAANRGMDYDPDMETEPGDWEPDEEVPAEETSEEVTEE